MKNPRANRDSAPPQPADRNISVIAELEHRALHERTRADRFSDAVTHVTGSTLFAVANLVLFVVWALVNSGAIGGWEPFDPYPFSLLTLVVSLEAILLAIFVLMSQNRMSRAADRRAHLNLQVDLLAEQELTTILRLLHSISEKLHVDAEVADEHTRQLLSDTDVNKIVSALDDRLPSK